MTTRQSIEVPTRKWRKFRNEFIVGTEGTRGKSLRVERDRVVNDRRKGRNKNKYLNQ